MRYTLLTRRKTSNIQPNHAGDRSMPAILTTILSAHEGTREAIIPILQQVQEELGYLPEDAMLQVARHTHVPASRVYGVATFYAQFRFTPLGKTHVMVCRGTACHVNGARMILEQTEEHLGIQEGETTPDLNYSLETVACIGACSLAPCAMINSEVEAKLTTQKVKAIFGRDG
jgi:NADH-quinone oxidoreductase subunit E|tara:strand:+ start:11192 stop:11710 length:519 start_codon:yes stop_codon:yes gene_type:complete